MKKEKKIHITIGIPLYGNMPVQSFASIMGLIHRGIDRSRITYTLCLPQNYPVHHARNYIVNEFLRNPNSDYLLFLDSDMVLVDEETFLNRLLRLIKSDCDIASALSFKKDYPFVPTMYRHLGEKYMFIEDWKQGEILEVDGIGMSSCLIKREVLEKIPPPWFEFKEIGKREYLSEDLTFCKKVNKFNFTIKVDTGLIAAHIGGSIDDRVYRAIYGSIVNPETEHMVKNIIENFLKTLNKKDIEKMLTNNKR